MNMQIAGNPFKKEPKPQIHEPNSILSAHALKDFIEKEEISKSKKETMKQDVNSIIELLWQGRAGDSVVKPLERIADVFEKTKKIPAKKRALAQEYLAGVRGGAGDAKRRSLYPTKVTDDFNSCLSKFGKVSETFRNTPIPKDLQGDVANLTSNVIALLETAILIESQISKSEPLKSNSIVECSINSTPKTSETPSSAPLVSPISGAGPFSTPLREAPAGITVRSKESRKDFDQREIKNYTLRLLYLIQKMEKIMKESTGRIEAGESRENWFVYAEGNKKRGLGT